MHVPPALQNIARLLLMEETSNQRPQKVPTNQTKMPRENQPFRRILHNSIQNSEPSTARASCREKTEIRHLWFRKKHIARRVFVPAIKVCPRSLPTRTTSELRQHECPPGAAADNRETLPLHYRLLFPPLEEQTLRSCYPSPLPYTTPVHTGLRNFCAMEEASTAVG